MSVEDPYFADHVIDGKSAQPPARLGRLVMGWVAVFCLNLIIPLLFASMMVGESRWVGIGLAALILLAAGGFAILRRRSVGVSLNLGGLVVAASQVFPFLQIYAGEFGLYVAHALGQSRTDDFLDGVAGNLGGFTATIVTGSLLIGIALAMGLVIRWMWSVRPRGPGMWDLPEPEWR